MFLSYSPAELLSAFLLAYTANGEAMWTRQFTISAVPGPAAVASAVAVAPSGDVAVVGVAGDYEFDSPCTRVQG